MQMASKLDKLYALRPLWIFVYLLMYAIYSFNSDRFTFEGAQMYLHGLILALWFLALSTESNLWKLANNTASSPIYKLLLTVSVHVLSLDVVAFYIGQSFRPVFFTASEKNAASMHTSLLFLSIFVFSLPSCFLSYIGHGRSYAENEFVQQRPAWVGALRLFRLAFCLLALLIGQGTWVFILYVYTDIAWIFASVLTDYYHDANEAADDLVESLEDEAKEYNMEMRIAALEKRASDAVAARPKPQIPKARYKRLSTLVFYGNVAWALLAAFLSGNASRGVANDLIFFLCLLCLIGTAFDTVGVTNYKTDEELEEIDEASTELWTAAADGFLESLPKWMKAYGRSLSHNAVDAIENFDPSKSSLTRALQITQFKNQIDYNKMKLDDPEAALAVNVSIAETSLRRRGVLKF